MRDMKSLSSEELREYLVSIGQKPYRADQIQGWLFKQHVLSFDEMENLPQNLREHLNQD